MDASSPIRYRAVPMRVLREGLQRASNASPKDRGRKTLNCQPQPRLKSGPKVSKPEVRAKKIPCSASRGNSSVRIGGLYNIPQKTVETTKPTRLMTIANKENNPYHANTIMKPLLPPPASVNHNKNVDSSVGTLMSSSLWKYGSGSRFLKPQLQKPESIIIPQKNVDSIADAPISNSSWKNGSDARFLQKQFDYQIESLLDEPIKENLADISKPILAPFEDYSSIQEYFNNSNMMENSALNNDTIIKTSICSDNHIADKCRVKLCNLCANVTTVGKTKPEVNEDMEPENRLNLIPLCVDTIKNVEAEIKRLDCTKDLLMEHLRESELINKKMAAAEKDTTLVDELNKQVRGIEAAKQRNEPNGVLSPIISRPCSVIKSCSECQVCGIPKNNFWLRNSEIITPVKNIEGEALNLYMKMKKEMMFLSTPMVNRAVYKPDTPTVVSMNVQKQLVKLFNDTLG